MRLWVWKVAVILFYAHICITEWLCCSNTLRFLHGLSIRGLERWLGWRFQFILQLHGGPQSGIFLFYGDIDWEEFHPKSDSKMRCEGENVHWTHEIFLARTREGVDSNYCFVILAFNVLVFYELFLCIFLKL